MGVMRIFGTLGAVSGLSLGLGVVTVSGGLGSLDAYRTALRVDVVIAAIAMPFAVGLGWLHFVGYPNPWKAARADGAALGAVADA